jgi:hypothetical protein
MTPRDDFASQQYPCGFGGATRLPPGASRGFFDYRMNRERFEDGFQSLPVDWTISSVRKRGFFGLLKEITGA